MRVLLSQEPHVDLVRALEQREGFVRVSHGGHQRRQIVQGRRYLDIVLRGEEGSRIDGGTDKVSPGNESRDYW